MHKYKVLTRDEYLKIKQGSTRILPIKTTKIND